MLVAVDRIMTVRLARNAAASSEYPQKVIVYGPHVEIKLDNADVIVTEMTFEALEALL